MECLFPNEHNNVMTMYMNTKEYMMFKTYLDNMERFDFIDGYIVTEAGDDIVEVIIYKEVKSND